MDWERLLKPMYWLQNKPTDLEWDKALNAALDRYEVNPGYITAKIGPFEVWGGNWPYAFGDRHSGAASGLPKVATRKRLRAAIKAARSTHMLELEAYRP